MEKIMDWLPHVVAAFAGVAVAVLGALASWEMAFGESGSLIGGLGMLLFATPLLALLIAAVNFWFIGLALTPIRGTVTRRKS